MLRQLTAILTALAFLMAAPLAFAQGGGGSGGGGKDGGGKGGGGGRIPGGGTGGGNNGGNNGGKPEEQPGPTWNPTLDQSLTAAGGTEKYILYYVYAPTELADPAAFKIKEIVDASNGNWIFTKKPLAKDDVELKEYKVTSAPTLIGMDKYGNEFKRTTTMSTAAIMAILKATPEAVTKFKTELAGKWKDAKEAAEEAKALKLLVEICTMGKKGYQEIEDSFTKVKEYGEKRIKAIEAQLTSDEAAAGKGLEQMLIDFKGTPPACAADTWIAKRERDSKIASAIARLLKVVAITDKHFKDEVEAAKVVLDELLTDGMQRVETAQKAAAAGEVEAAQGSLRKLTNEFKGTEVAKKAAEALKSLEQ